MGAFLFRPCTLTATLSPPLQEAALRALRSAVHCPGADSNFMARAQSCDLPALCQTVIDEYVDSAPGTRLLKTLAAAALSQLVSGPEGSASVAAGLGTRKAGKAAASRGGPHWNHEEEPPLTSPPPSGSQWGHGLRAEKSAARGAGDQPPVQPVAPSPGMLAFLGCATEDTAQT